ncbi:DUF6602 domain-containing protein [Paenarthrobacter sp. CM16]|jgi:hypothetical protein|uniref:DUF6602 domain-containing protein n=1 Tax=Paenarthrobacter sp. CM16 TaxID=2738447 RepID=UPI0035C69AFF
MGTAAKQLQLSLQQIRDAYGHNLTIGTEAEDVLREFLAAHLPDSIGVANGQIVDSLGSESRQVDVILYDKARTPALYRGLRWGFPHLESLFFRNVGTGQLVSGALSVRMRPPAWARGQLLTR